MGVGWYMGTLYILQHFSANVKGSKNNPFLKQTTIIDSIPQMWSQLIYNQIGCIFFQNIKQKSENFTVSYP